MTDKTCQNCSHFHPTDKDRLAGECRCHAPQMFVSTLDQYHWPKVDGLDWCGQFLSRENLYEKKKKK